ncbi:DinB family protein [Kordia sp.]|uniref:DinB family protein n=1 Tax=Kordia sp. TaxID=1965332 RepID=UPI003B5BB555
MEKYINYFELNTDKLLETIKGYPIEKLTKKNGSEWNVLEILEHIYITDKVIYSIVSKPSESESKTTEIVGQGKLETILVDQRNKKLQTPELLKPKGHFQNLTDFNSAFSTLRNTIKNDLATEKIRLDNRIHNHFLLGEMTITDWLNFILFHTERHLKQIEDRMKINTVANNV